MWGVKCIQIVRARCLLKRKSKKNWNKLFFPISVFWDRGILFITKHIRFLLPFPSNIYSWRIKKYFDLKQNCEHRYSAHVFAHVFVHVFFILGLFSPTSIASCLCLKCVISQSCKLPFVKMFCCSPLFLLLCSQARHPRLQILGVSLPKVSLCLPQSVSVPARISLARSVSPAA